MIIHPVYTQDSPPGATPTPYDSIWTSSEVPANDATGLESIMLAEDKLYVVLAVVLIIWFGILFFIWRTDRKLRTLERTVQVSISEEIT